MTVEEIVGGVVVRHYKGGTYTVLGVSRGHDDPHGGILHIATHVDLLRLGSMEYETVNVYEGWVHPANVTGKTLVIYQHTSGVIWARDIDDWLSPTADGQQRFTIVAPAGPMTPEQARAARFPANASQLRASQFPANASQLPAAANASQLPAAANASQKPSPE